MAIVHHPDVTTLMTCAAGSQPEALCAVVTSHLAMCPKCMRELSALEEIGVSLFEHSLDGQQVAESKLPKLTDVTEHTEERPQRGAEGDVPYPLIDLVGNDLDAVAWTEILPGIATAALVLSPNAKGDLRLLRLDPGKSLPEHGHFGEELTLVLRGSCRDQNGRLSVGDISDVDDDTTHAVVAGEAGCILLIGSETRPAFLEELEKSAA